MTKTFKECSYLMINGSTKCTETFFAKNLCKKHYHREYRNNPNRYAVPQSDVPVGFRWCLGCETILELVEFGKAKKPGKCLACRRVEHKTTKTNVSGGCYVLYDHGSKIPRAKFGRSKNLRKRVHEYTYKYPWLKIEFLSDTLSEASFWEAAMRNEFRDNLYTQSSKSEWLEGVPLNELLLAAETYAKEFK